jgi:hypothetical protein
MTPEDLLILAREKVWGFGERLKQESFVLASIDSRHQAFDVVANQEVPTSEPKELAQTHVAVCDLPQLLWIG